jgi:hypothetical protein
MPFYLAHRRLLQLERTMMAAAEGGTRSRALMLLRHEAGHCFDHAYRIAGTAGWRRHFGRGGTGPYRPEAYRPEAYRPDRQSRDFVRHLPGFYAQAHPDEDFAETFAVVVTPGLDWRGKYRGWKRALEKLEFMEGLIREKGGQVPKGNVREEWGRAAALRMTLGRFYEKRLKA